MRFRNGNEYYRFTNKVSEKARKKGPRNIVRVIQEQITKMRVHKECGRKRIAVSQKRRIRS